MNSAPVRMQKTRQSNITATHKNLSIYYSHPIKTYGTDRESRAILLLKQRFPNHAIINPRAYRFEDMRGYLKLEAQCNVFAYHKALNGRFTKGVALERLLAFIMSMPIYKIGSQVRNENPHVITYPSNLLSDLDYDMAFKITDKSEGLP
jgi:hypothetical protein